MKHIDTLLLIGFTALVLVFVFKAADHALDMLLGVM